MTQELLYNKKLTREDSYQFSVNHGGELDLHPVERGDKPTVTLVFVNGEFSNVDFDCRLYNIRNRYFIYGAISEKVREIEKSYKAQK